jgi:hypothetical protein
MNWIFKFARIYNAVFNLRINRPQIKMLSFNTIGEVE